MNGKQLREIRSRVRAMLKRGDLSPARERAFEKALRDVELAWDSPVKRRAAIMRVLRLMIESGD
ncbi:MAG: hypothetical protein AB7I09_19865 [Planctomycetota bacterium]